MTARWPSRRSSGRRRFDDRPDGRHDGRQDGRCDGRRNGRRDGRRNGRVSLEEKRPFRNITLIAYLDGTNKYPNPSRKILHGHSAPNQAAGDGVV